VSRGKSKQRIRDPRALSESVVLTGFETGAEGSAVIPDGPQTSWESKVCATPCLRWRLLFHAARCNPSGWRRRNPLLLQS